MCDPASALIGAGTAVKVGGDLWSGSQANKAAQVRAAELEAQAALRIQKGEFDADASGRKFERTRGQAYASIGNQGFDIASFSDVLADATIEGALEQKVIRFQAAQEAAALRAQANAARESGKSSKIGSYFSAAGSAFSGASKIKF